jgi:large subunit ribosomal protein L25
MRRQLKAGPIEAHTKGEVKRLRKQGLIPISIQHRGQQTLHLQEEARPLQEFIHQHGEAALLEIAVQPDGRVETVLVRDVQRDPVTHALTQVTFQRVVRGERIKTHVHIILRGEPEAVKRGTAVIQRPVEVIEVQCDAQNLPDHVFAEIGSLQYGDVVRVSDLTGTKDLEILTPPDTVIASLSSVTTSNNEVEAAEAADAAATADAAAAAAE